MVCSYLRVPSCRNSKKVRVVACLYIMLLGEYWSRLRLLLLNDILGNALLRNHDGQNALDIARTNRQTVVVRAIQIQVSFQFYEACINIVWILAYNDQKTQTAN